MRRMAVLPAPTVSLEAALLAPAMRRMAVLPAPTASLEAALLAPAMRRMAVLPVSIVIKDMTMIGVKAPQNILLITAMGPE